MLSLGSPLEISASLDALNRRRLLAAALRNKALGDNQTVATGFGGQMVLPGGVGRALAGALGGSELNDLDAQEQQLLKGYEERLSGATQGILKYADPFAQEGGPVGGSQFDDTGAGAGFATAPRPSTTADMGRAASEAMVAGVPQALIDRIMQQRMGVDTINNVLGPDSPLARPGGGGSASPPPAAAAPDAVAGPSGGPLPAGASIGFLPGGPQPAAKPALAGASGSTPFANMSDRNLFVLASLPNPMQDAYKQELKAREIKFEAGTAYDYRGRPLYTINRNTGMVTDYTNRDADGNPTVYDPLKDLTAARAGAVKGAEVKAAAPFEFETVPTNLGKAVRSRAELAAAAQARSGGAPAVSTPAPTAIGAPASDATMAAEVAPLTSQQRALAATQGGGIDAATGKPVPPDIQAQMAAEAQKLLRQQEIVGSSPSITAEKFASANAEAQKPRVEAIMNEGAASKENDAFLADISHHLHNADTSSIAPARQALGEWLNSMGFGTDSPITQFVVGGNLGALQAINKDSVQLAATATKALGSREAAQIFMMLLKANPNIATSPDGLAKIVDFMHGMNQYKIDRFEGMSPWIQNSPTGDIQGYESTFMKLHPPTSYVAHLQPGASQSPGDQGRGNDISGGVASPARGAKSGARGLTPAEQQEYNALKARFGQ